MKIFFAFPIAGDRSSIDSAKKIVGMLESLGHHVTTKIFLEREKMQQQEKNLTPQEKYALDLKWLLEADVLVGEISNPSYGMGFEAGYLLGATDKKVILVHSRQNNEKITAMARGNTHPNCTVFEYDDVNELRDFFRNNLGACA